MNRSYSKIRHIQESNLRLEGRLLNEQPVVPSPVVDAPTPVEDKPEPNPLEQTEIPLCTSKMTFVKSDDMNQTATLDLTGKAVVIKNRVPGPPQFDGSDLYVDGVKFCFIPRK